MVVVEKVLNDLLNRQSKPPKVSVEPSYALLSSLTSVIFMTVMERIRAKMLLSLALSCVYRALLKSPTMTGQLRWMPGWASNIP